MTKEKEMDQEQMEPRKSGKKAGCILMILALVFLVGGVGGGAYLALGGLFRGFKDLSSLQDTIKEFHSPGTKTLDLKATGVYTIFHVSAGSLGKLPKDLKITIKDPEDKEITVLSSSIDKTLEYNGAKCRAAYVFTVDKAGSYEVKAKSLMPAQFLMAKVSLGGFITGLIGIGLLILGGLLALIFGIVGLVKLLS